MDAVPRTEFVVSDYRLQPAPEIRWLVDGAKIDLAVTVVHPGYGDSFDGARLREIASAYLERVVSH
jgi:hypothetical protein